MSEELTQKHLTKNGRKVGPYEFYNIGSTTLNQLKKYKIVPDKSYGKYGSRKPDALLIDRRDQDNVKVMVVVEGKSQLEFEPNVGKEEAVEQCNDLAQELNAPVGIATDGASFIWFNPKQENKEHEYQDKTTGKIRSYALIKDIGGGDFTKEFVINQQVDETDNMKLSPKTRLGLKWLALVVRSISVTNSQITEDVVIDPTALAEQIWQDVWSVSGATPEKCLYTFVELFIFKYLSDLGILTEDDKGNKVNFRDIFQLPPDKAFKNYSYTVRPHLRLMFPADEEDGTTIINGTVLNPDVPEHSQVFYKILKKFDRFGEMKNIDPQFKSRVFEAFMKESISKKNWGQVFTPRNIIGAMIEMSDIDQLEEGSQIADPACGVGGFVLEPMKVREDGVNFYYRIDGEDIIPRFNFFGFDKGFEKEEQLTIILAKANMLIFLSGLLRENPTLTKKFSALFNRTFKLLSKTILGTLSRLEEDQYDLILTNPPYVTSGSSNYKDAIKNDAALSKFYKINATGVEGLFLEWIIRSLKPSRKAFVIIPDGILNRLNDNKLRAFIKEQCLIDGIISLPVNAFYTSQKKTYILAITKKHGKSEEERKGYKQKEPVFTYLVSNIGETLDVNRFVISDNDLLEMVSLFNQFKGAKGTFQSSSKRCKIQPIEMFDPDDHWIVDRWWSKEERVALGVESESIVEAFDDFKERVKGVTKEMQGLLDVTVSIPSKGKSIAVGEIFDLKQKTNHSKFTKAFVNKHKGNIPVYSASKSEDEPSYGYLEDNLPGIRYFNDILTWNIDGSVGKAIYRQGRFTLSEKVIPLILKPHWVGILDNKYLKYALEKKAIEYGFTFSNKAGKTRIKDIEITIPLDDKGNLDFKKQQEIASEYERLEHTRKQLRDKIETMFSVEIDFQQMIDK